MHKLFAVFKREYLQAVRKKMFIIMTVLLPVLLAAVFIIPSMAMVKGLGKKQITIIDGTGRLTGAFDRAVEPADASSPNARPGRHPEVPTSMTVTYVARPGEPHLDAVAKPYLDRLSSDKKGERLDGVLVIPADAFSSSAARMKYYSRSSTDFIVQERLSGMANRAIQRHRLTDRGISAADVEQITTETPVDTVQVSKSGEQKKGGPANLIIGIVFAALLMMPSFVYGLEIMRGIIQEKNDRVVEVLVSSMHPRQLLTGKILGIAAVGLTQIAAWLLMLAVIGGVTAATAVSAGVDLGQYLHPSTFIYFVVFFLLAYLTYVCIYAIGGAVCNSEKEAQQLIAPITLTMMLPWFMIGALITNPDSPLVVGLSVAPVWGPLTMFVRTLISDPPISQVLMTVATSVVTVAALFWATAKIFRIGILSYGKRPTIPELWRWMKVA
jgi:ABC-2 type transport system permease protein